MKNFLNCSLMAILAIFVPAALAFAEDQNSVTAKAVVASNNAAASEKQVLTPVEQKMQKLVSVDFRNTPMEDVIRILAAQANIDIVKSPSVVGNVTATLKDVPLGEALRNILAAHGYTYVADQHLIRVVAKTEVAEQQEALVNKVYQVTYADVKDVEAALKKFISPRGSISSNPGTSNIIVTDTEGKIRAIDTFIAEVDRMTPQILVEARIYDITSTDRLDVGVDWQAGRPTTFNLPGGTTPTSSTQGVLSVGTNPTGRDNPFDTGAFGGGGAGQTQTTTGAFRFGWLNENVDIDVLLRAQKEDLNAKLLANPRVLVLDNETAQIKIVHEIPYQQLNQGLGVASFGTIEFKEVGVTLKVTPHITRDGIVRLKLQPEFSVQAENVNVGGSASGDSRFPVPAIDKRTADTTLLTKDGQTVVLGGLRKKEVAQQINKIPLLGDIPVVGMLFRFSGEKTVLSEIVVFVTPHIIKQPLATGDLTAAEQKAFGATEFKGPKPSLTEAEKAAKQDKCSPEAAKGKK